MNNSRFKHKYDKMSFVLDFFKPFHKKRLFLSVNENYEEADKFPADQTIKKHTMYTLGSSWRLLEACKELTGKTDISVSILNCSYYILC